MNEVRHAKLFRNGANRAVRIPVDMDFEGDEVTLRKEGEQLIVEPVHKKPDLAEWLATLEPWEEDFPNIKDDILPADDVNL